MALQYVYISMFLREFELEKGFGYHGNEQSKWSQSQRTKTRREAVITKGTCAYKQFDIHQSMASSNCSPAFGAMAL